MPIMDPRVAPTIAQLLAPTRRAPRAEATKSTTIARAVSTARITRGSIPIMVKSCHQAIKNIPAKIMGVPGSAGIIVPSTPTTIDTMAINQISVR